MTLGDLIKDYRQSHSLTMQEFADRSGLSKAYISMLEKNRHPRNNKKIIPSLDTFKKVSNVMNMSLNEILQAVNSDQLIEVNGREEPSSPYAKPPELPIINDDGTVKLKAFPLVGEIACHEPMFINEEHETILAPETVNADFCVKARGDSMTGARIMNGDIVFIKRTSDRVPNGKIVAVTIDDTVTLKRIFYYPDENMVTLVPENPSYSTQIYKGEELDHMRILGVAVGATIAF